MLRGDDGGDSLRDLFPPPVPVVVPVAPPPPPPPPCCLLLYSRSLVRLFMRTFRPERDWKRTGCCCRTEEATRVGEGEREEGGEGGGEEGR